jgi:nucleotide-binding universal stress UspA family protein
METTMIDIQRILCPIDFSDFSRRALDHAVAMARWYKASITAVHVDPAIEIVGYPAPMVGVPATWKFSDRAELVIRLQRFVELESAPGISIGTVVREGPAVTEILDQAAATSADLIVMGTHGTSGFERLVLGSVTEKVLRKARCPVLTVPRAQPDAVPAGPVVFKRIVCGVDFSDCSLAALKYALSLAQEADGQLTVVHVLTSQLVPDAVLADQHLSVLAYQRQRKDEAQRRLDEAVPATSAEYCRVESTIVRGKPWREIVGIATAQQSDLIVLGVHGRGPVDLMFFGSTAHQVVRHASCPVLTLRQK